MSFEAPDASPALSTELRELEQSAPKTTPGAVRAALLRAAQQLEFLERQAADAECVLAEASALRIGAMDSASRAQDINSRISRAIREAIEILARRAR